MSAAILTLDRQAFNLHANTIAIPSVLSLFPMVEASKCVSLPMWYASHAPTSLPAAEDVLCHVSVRPASHCGRARIYQYTNIPICHTDREKINVGLTPNSNSSTYIRCRRCFGFGIGPGSGSGCGSGSDSLFRFGCDDMTGGDSRSIGEPWTAACRRLRGLC